MHRRTARTAAARFHLSRRGQTGEVKVDSYVVADCAEEHVWRRTHCDAVAPEEGVA